MGTISAWLQLFFPTSFPLSHTPKKLVSQCGSKSRVKEQSEQETKTQEHSSELSELFPTERPLLVAVLK